MRFDGGYDGVMRVSVGDHHAFILSADLCGWGGVEGVILRHSFLTLSL